MRLLIEGCAILNADQPQGYTSDQYILLEDKLIAAVSPERPTGDFDRILSGSNRLAIPGLINAHTHSPENFLRATSDCLTLEPWLVYLFGMGGEFSPRDYYLSAMLGVIEMVRSGVTGVVDHLWMNPPLNTAAMDAAMTAYRDSGLRAVVAPLYRDAQYEVDYGIAAGYPLADTFFAQLSHQFPSLEEVLASSDNQVLFEALRLAALIHNPGEADSDRWLSAREAWHMATTAGAVVLGLPDKLGHLKPGYLINGFAERVDHP